MMITSVPSLKLNSSRQSARVAIACVIMLALGAATVLGNPLFLHTYATANDNSDSNLAFGAFSSAAVPLRVDYRDRNGELDTDVLGMSTGMCSISKDCNVCSYRDINPCKVADRYGANPSLCQLPSFLGGAVSSDTLCGIGATIDVTLTAPYSSNNDSNTSSNSTPTSSPTVVAMLTAFRTRTGTLKLTLTARCGWILLPFVSSTASSTAAIESNADGVGEPLAMMEGSVSYYDTTLPLTIAPYSSEEGGEGMERYTCFTGGLQLPGLSSRCQGLDLHAELRIAVQRVEIVGGINESIPPPDCRVESPALEAMAHLSMQIPKGHAAADCPSASTASVSAVASTAALAALRQRIFSNGVAAHMSYTSSVDPREPEATSWLQSLATQFPVVSVTPESVVLSFMIGSVRKDLRGSLAPPAVGGGLGGGENSAAAQPLLPAGSDLETCGRQSIKSLTASVVSVLAAKGISERYVSDVVCLQPPFKDVPQSELPPCAASTSVLFNITLEIPQSSLTATTSSLSSSAISTVSTGSSNTISFSDGTSVSLQALADELVGAQQRTPWACLSTQSQMRMRSRMTVDLQLPRGPGLEVDMIGSGESTSKKDSMPPAVQPPIAASMKETVEEEAGVPVSRSFVNGDGKGDSNKGFGTAAIVAVAAAVALSVIVVVVIAFAVRSIRKSRAEVARAAHSAAAAVIATTAAATALATGGNQPGGVGPDKLSPPSPFKDTKLKTLEPPPSPSMNAEASYASTATSDADNVRTSLAICSPSEKGARVADAAPPSASARGDFPTDQGGALAWILNSAFVSGGGSIGSISSGGVRPGGGGTMTPLAAAANLEPFAAAVEAATAAAAAVPSGDGKRSLVLMAEKEEESDDENDEKTLSSVRVPLMSMLPTAVPNSVMRGSASSAVPARIFPLTPPPVNTTATDAASALAVRSPTSLPGWLPGPGQPMPRCRSLTQRAVSATVGSNRSSSVSPAGAVHGEAADTAMEVATTTVTSVGTPTQLRVPIRRDVFYSTLETGYGARLKSLTSLQAMGQLIARPESPRGARTTPLEPTVWCNALYDAVEPRPADNTTGGGSDQGTAAVANPTLLVPTMPIE